MGKEKKQVMDQQTLRVNIKKSHDMQSINLLRLHFLGTTSGSQQLIAYQPSTNVANFTDTDLQPVDMIPSKDPGNDFTTHGYSSQNLVCTHYSYNITILHVLNLDNNKIANKGHTMSCTFSESL